MPDGKMARSLVEVLAGAPGASKLCRALLPDGSWSAALFHHLAPAETALTHGLGVTYSPHAFERWLDLCADRYLFSSLDEVRRARREVSRRRRLLLTFDDAYLSVARVAAPLLAERGIPSLFFVNFDSLDNRSLALDNLIAGTANLVGMAPIEKAAGRRFASIGDVIDAYVANLNRPEREQFREGMCEASGLTTTSLLDTYRPYLSSEDLQDLPGLGMEIGNHTRSHVFCRTLDEGGIEDEILANQRNLELLVHDPVRTFAYPYGREKDATPRTLHALAESGHSDVFLVGGRLNRSADTPGEVRPYIHHRVSVSALSAGEAVLELEWLPLIRAARSRLRKARA